METKWSNLFVKLYGRIRRQQQKRRLENLLVDLIKQKKRISDQISTVERLLKESEQNLEDQPAMVSSYSKIYMELIDNMFSYTSTDISSFICDIAFTSVEIEADISPSEIYHLVSYKMSASVIESLELHNKKNHFDLEKCNPRYYTYFAEEDDIYKSIFYLLLLREYFDLYNTALDKDKTDLELLVSHKTDSQNAHIEEYRSQLQSQLFRSILSKYIYSWRSQNNITQSELAQISGVDRTMIAKIEKLQQTASVDTTIKLLNATNASLLILPGGKGLQEQ